MNQVCTAENLTATEDWDLVELNRILLNRTAEQRVDWAVSQFPEQLVLSSSFGAQAAVSLHLVTQRLANIPVLLIDTGYLFAETYQFIEELTLRLDLNLKIYTPELTPARQEALYGKLWEQGLEGIEQYNRINKVEPMRRALQELDARAWLSGIRRVQSHSRKERQFVEQAQNGEVLKVHPLLDWDDKDIFNYLKKNDLPYHPLWDEGYVSIGDIHTTRRLTEDITEEETRFFGLKRECGLHDEV